MRFPVTVEIQPSRRLRAALLFAHLLAAAALVAGAIHYPLLLAGLPLLGVSLARAWRRSLPQVFRLGEDGALFRVAADGSDSPLELLPGAVVFGWLVVLRVRAEGQRVPSALVVLADCLPSGPFRALRVWLRWRAKFSGGVPV
ncbi:protein YgfX [Azospira restricta]|uniref:Toxin CptA n=1 Tax=Azospira restricta TaxID=404405 RepID=A0A974PX65_9RHOO|nr:protein YgfX [Azospira restricta]QRJ62808.1 hypothetical protein IWH25_13670 [Azospira restricta]